MKILLIDNFDSFTFNLYQYLGELAEDVIVARNNDIPLERIRDREFSHIVISPGPGSPTDPAYFGANNQVIKEFYKKYPVLGICLGHQGIGAVFGAKVIKATTIMHGKTSTFSHSGEGIMIGLPDEITAMRYHSLVVDRDTLPDELIIDAVADDGSIMAFHHRDYPTFGLQFHPESFRTDTGKTLLGNFLKERLQ